MAAEFPLPSVSASNPIPSFFQLEPEEFVVTRTIYDDNGADYKLQAGGSGRLVWVLRYSGLTPAKAALLDAHVATCFYSPEEGSATGFNFRTHIAGEAWTSTNGTLYASVHYAPGGYKKDNVRNLVCRREIILEKRS